METTNQNAGRVVEHLASTKTYFTPGTPKRVQSILEKARRDYRDYPQSAPILRVFYGDVETGRDWGEENDTIGFIGRSMGPMKVPLLIEPLRTDFAELRGSSGGGAILTHCIVRIIDVRTHTEVYRADNYQMPVFAIGESQHKDLPVQVSREGKAWAAFKDHDGAAEYIAFMQGYRVARPFRSEAEYNKEMREAA